MSSHTSAMAPSLPPHQTNITALKRLIRNGRLPSALLFHGERGIGKREVATSVARALLCQSPVAGRTEATILGCGVCQECTVFTAGNHVDYHYLDLADTEAWTTASFRSFLGSLNLRSFSGGARVILFDNTEAMSMQSANALLKSLEEPRPDTYFILVSSAPTKLPQTILSRCQPFYFAPLSPESLSAPVKSDKKDEDSAILAAMADGSRAIAELLSAHRALYVLVRDAVQATSTGGSAEAVLRARECCQKKGDIGVLITFLQRYLRYCLVREADPLRKRRYALALTNALEAERLIEERHLGAVGVITAVLEGLAPDATPQPWATNREQLLSSYTLP